MITVDDFTTLEPGTGVPEGDLVVCPRCGRPGAAQFFPDGEELVIHLQASELFGDGLLTEPLDVCRLA